jgi:long-subunit fatty acid transport protein
LPGKTAAALGNLEGIIMFIARDLRVVQNRVQYPRTSKCPGKTFAVLLLTLFVSNSHASALYVPETANPTDTAFAGAGLSVRAQDAGTVFTNPAGMTRFHKSAMLVSAGATYVHAPFEPDSANTISGTDGSATGWVPYGTFAYIHPVSDRLKLGVSVGNNFGLSLDWGTNWVGRYTTTEASLFESRTRISLCRVISGLC